MSVFRFFKTHPFAWAIILLLLVGAPLIHTEGLFDSNVIPNSTTNDRSSGSNSTPAVPSTGSNAAVIDKSPVVVSNAASSSGSVGTPVASGDALFKSSESASAPSSTGDSGKTGEQGVATNSGLTNSLGTKSATNDPKSLTTNKPPFPNATAATPAKVEAPVCTIPVDAPPNLDQPPDKMAATAQPPPTENVTLNLINRLVQRGILKKEDAEDLIRQANDDAQRVVQQNQLTQQAAQQAAAAQQMAVDAGAPPSSDETVSVSYVPEIVKAEMRDEIKRDVMAAAQSEGWNQKTIPDWITKFRPFMDNRFRFQGNYYPSGNTTNPLDTLNFAAINSAQPFNISQANGNQSPPIGYPTYNTAQNRQAMRIRVRFGVDMDLGDNFTSGIRIGTGQNGNPVSENQTLGSPQNYGNPSYGGNFSSYAIWLDRAFLKYEIGSDPDRLAALTFGRFDNPFYTPTTMMWANDIGFDGIVAQIRYKIHKWVTPFLSAGIFPVYNTDLNYASTQQPKYGSYDKYLYAAQTGTELKITKDFHFKGALGYYNFQNVQGQVSAPQVAYDQTTQFNTDNSRPSFAQKGNTYIALRNIPKVAENNYGQINQYQYFGLATPFQILSANGRLQYRRWEPFVVSLSGEWDQNLAWDYNSIINNGPPQLKGPINNPGANGTGYGGGNNAWIIQAKVGSGALQKRWDWDFGVDYRYVESDAVIDGFCDSDFGGGGTNLKGFTVGGNLALSRSVFIGMRWFSATAIAGPQFKSDIIQIDLNSRF